ncbi:hypothetical protein M427DRAFT_61184 [Gonapodya prolifera JEL478]|uniref:Uncharacterized protein n=1 Tax=Gonapodya prolifera (strain JEL478) TaxID=1344416 RepID=A0A139A2T6_GONPJ|nr:hypothetical protein M427DRAFT_61184 [Gonapodya prolifera JEL478]|eukprot:KXS11097.1 hypothetical protein M427DRAFT_61184 [Gonapodya prolifera JEL478]
MFTTIPGRPCGKKTRPTSAFHCFETRTQDWKRQRERVPPEATRSKRVTSCSLVRNTLVAANPTQE